MTSVEGHPVYVFNLNTEVDLAQGRTHRSSTGCRCAATTACTSPGAAAIFVGLRLLPDLAVLGQAHRVGLSRWRLAGGQVPASTPSWFDQTSPADRNDDGAAEVNGRRPRRCRAADDRAN